MSAAELQSLLRFLSQDAKVPLTTAISKVKELQKLDLDSLDKLAKTKADKLMPLFADEKVAKQIVTAAKRVAKKRAAGDESAPSPKRKRKESLLMDDGTSSADLESSLSLPYSLVDEDELSRTNLFTNRAPLVLAFTVTLLKHTMREQPLSSRLSLAQAYVSTTSRARAVNLGIESGLSAEEEGFGEGQPFVKIMGKELRVMRRWGYEWRTDGKVSPETTEDAAEELSSGPKGVNIEHEVSVSQVHDTDDEKPALWALDLEALRKSNQTAPIVSSTQAGPHSNLPIYTPQSARAYLLKSFDSPPNEAYTSSKKPSASAKRAEKERNLGKLLRALDLLYDSWQASVGPAELDKRTWSWYVKVRPEVENGVAGWGGKNILQLSDVLALRRETN